MHKKSLSSITKLVVAGVGLFGLAQMWIAPSIPVVSAAPCPQPTPSGSPIPLSTYGDLGRLRAAVSIFYGDTEGRYPKDLNELIPKYLAKIPACVTNQGSRVGVTYYTSNVTSLGKLDTKKIMGSGKWGYVSNPSATDAGFVFIDTKQAQDSSATAMGDNAGWLSAMRSAISIYYGDTEGEFPKDLSDLIKNRNYLPGGTIPYVVTCAKGSINKTTNYATQPTLASQIKDTGGWGYVPSTGYIFIDAREDNLFKKYQ